MSKRAYTDAEKAAYYKAKANKARAYGGYSPKGKSADYYKQKRRMYKAKIRASEPRKRQDPGALSAIGGEVGAIAGGPIPVVGPIVGRLIGAKLGHLVENITGFGDYKYQSNSIMKGMMQPAQVVNSVNKGSFIVRHREYLGDINATSLFTLASYPINPGMSQTFPWLSGIAQNFEQYRMRGCLFEFLSTSSDALLMSAASSALGTVNMATEYDSLESNFSSKREMLNHEFANSRKPSLSFIHPVECKRNRTPVSEQYVRTGPVPSNADLRLYDLGKFQIATEGMQANTGVCGELWVTYEVELFKAKYETTYANSGLSDHWKLVSPVGTNPLGSGSYRTTGSTLGGSITGISSYAFPSTVSPGDQFLINYTMSAINNAVILYPVVTFANCVGVPFYGATSSTAGIYSPQAGATTTTCAMTLMITIQAVNAVVTWGTTGTLPGTSATGDLVVTQVASGLQVKPEIETPCEEVLEEDDRDLVIKDLELEVKRLQLMQRKSSQTTIHH